MALKDIFTMVKADRYTADGCEELNKAREADVEDRRYNIGEISEKTGLQKTANGWVKPKSGGASKGEKKASSGANKGTENSDIKNFDTTKLEKMKTEFEEYKKAGRIVPEGAEERYKAVKSELEKRNGGSSSESQGVEAAKKFPVDPLQGTESKPAAGNKPDQLDETTGYENKSLFELQDIYNSNEGKKLEGSVKEQHEKIAKELQKRITNEPTKNKGFKKGDRVFNRYGETANVLATAGDFVLVENRGRKEWQSENAYQGKVATDSAPRVLTGDTRIRVRKS